MRSLGLIRIAILAASLIASASGIGAACAAQQQAQQTGNPPSAQASTTPRNDSHVCAQPGTPGIRTMRWGYYPGYGCGPVPPARTIYP